MMNAATANLEPMTDPRSNKPSASNFARYRGCPGSLALSQGLPDVETPWSKQGDGIHAWLRAKLTRDEVPPVPTMTADDEETAETCLKLIDRACAAAGYGSRASAKSVLCEQRLWMDDSWSGQFDLLLQFGARWLLVDFKTGRLEAEEPADNQQLRALVALVSANYFPSEVTVAIIQPWVSPQIPPLARYDRAAMEKAEFESEALYLASQTPGAPRTPGDHCKYCPACQHAVCPEQRATVAVVAAVPNAALMDHREVAKWLIPCEMAELVIEAVRKRAKLLLGSLEPGSVLECGDVRWALKPGVERESICDIRTVWQRTAAKGVSSDRFIAGVSVTKKELTLMLREATGTKGAALEAAVTATLEGCTESKTTAPSLRRV